MISGRNSETTYEQTEKRKPGNTSSVTAAPPRTCRRSSTSTLRPARARYAAAVSPLCPPPMTIASYFIGEISDCRIQISDWNTVARLVAQALTPAEGDGYRPQLRVALPRIRERKTRNAKAPMLVPRSLSGLRGVCKLRQQPFAAVERYGDQRYCGARPRPR